MPRTIAQYLPRKIAALGLADAALSFATIYAFLALTGSSVQWPDLIAALPSTAATAAAALTTAIVAAALVIGLYRTEVRGDRGRSLLAAVVVGVVAFSILIAASSDPAAGLSVARIVLIGELLGAWVAVTVLFRLLYAVAVHNRHRMIGTTMTQALAQSGAVRPGLVSSRGTVVAGTVFPLHRPARLDLDTLTLDALSPIAANGPGSTAKRIGDIVVATALVILTLPVMALTAWLIKMDSPGPVFERQRRSGHRGAPFFLLRYRCTNVGTGGDPSQPRAPNRTTTRVGRLLRSSRVEVLPQLWNVIRGEMSLVGPRPERPHFAEQLTRSIPFYEYRMQVKPGLTGWAQVNSSYGRNVNDVRESLAFDLYYVRHQSLMLDTAILFSTVRSAVTRKGAR